jgi:hypothetical protein
MDLARRDPGDTLAFLVALGLAVAILVNALALQKAHHVAAVHRAAPAPVARRVPMPPPAVTPLPRPETTTPIAAPAPPAAAVHESPAALVEAIQTELKRRGVYRDKIDGALGPNTEAAIRSYQHIAGLEATGQPSAALLALLRGKR